MGRRVWRGGWPHRHGLRIPTKDHRLRTMPLHEIKRYVDDFLTYAWMNSHLEFHVVAIGTGLAGYHHDQIAPLFNTAPDNCILPKEWGPILERFREPT